MIVNLTNAQGFKTSGVEVGKGTHAFAVCDNYESRWFCHLIARRNAIPSLRRRIASTDFI